MVNVNLHVFASRLSSICIESKSGSALSLYKYDLFFCNKAPYFPLILGRPTSPENIDYWSMELLFDLMLLLSRLIVALVRS